MKGIKTDLRKIFQLSYRLFLFSIREYRPNEMYASQWIDFMINQTIHCDPENDINAEPTLTELIDNNKYERLESFKKTNIQKCISWCQRYKLPFNKVITSNNIFLTKGSKEY